MTFSNADMSCVYTPGLKNRRGTVLFVSHDRTFVQNTAEEILQIENREIIKFPGTLKEWEQEQKRRRDWNTPISSKYSEATGNAQSSKKADEEKMLLELQLARLTGQLGHTPSLEEKERLEEAVNPKNLNLQPFQRPRGDSNTRPFA